MKTALERATHKRLVEIATALEATDVTVRVQKKGLRLHILFILYPAWLRRADKRFLGSQGSPTGAEFSVPANKHSVLVALNNLALDLGLSGTEWQTQFLNTQEA